MNYLPLQYCQDIHTEAENFSKEELEEFFKAFSNRDFGKFYYSIMEKRLKFWNKKKRKILNIKEVLTRAQDRIPGWLIGRGIGVDRKKKGI